MDQVKRVNYFQGMMLVDEDFRDEQNYHRQTRHNHNLELHTWGVVRGLEVSLKAGALDVTEGLAIDANGKEIWWKGGAATAAGKPDDGVYLVIEWNEELSDEYSQMAGKYLRLIDTSKFSFKSAAEANDVVLAKISVKDGQVQERPDNSVRRTASSVRANGGDLEIRPVAGDGSLRLMNGAPLTARLTIDAKGNVGIANDLSVMGALSGARLSTSHIKLRGDDGNHGISYFGEGAAKEVGDFALDGPVLYGYHGGALGCSNGEDKKNKTVALRWNDQGRVGIGTTDPQATLQVGKAGSEGAPSLRIGWGEGNNEDRLTIYNSETFRMGLRRGTRDLKIFAKSSDGDGHIYLMPNDTVAMSLMSNGNIGIGTTNPQAPLVVSNKAAKVSMLKLLNTNGAAGDQWWLGFDHGADSTDDNDRARVGVDILGGGAGRLFFTTGLAKQQQERMRIDESGNVGVGTPEATARLTIRAAVKYVPIGLPMQASVIGDTNVYSPGNEPRFGSVKEGDVVKIGDETRKVTRAGAFGLRVDSAFKGTGGEVPLTVVRVTSENIFRADDQAGNPTLFVSGDGNVGIGTTTPTQARLVVIGGANDFPVFSGAAISYFSQQDNPGVINRLSAGEAFKSKYIGQTMSIYASDNIWSGYSFVSSSDERIKNIQGRSDSATDLRTLLGIEITDYRYKDVIGKGNDTYKKVIGQQVEKVFPQAVSKQTGVVPDIYRQASIQDGWTELATNLKKGERVKLITKKGEEGVHEVLEVATDKFRTDFKPEGDKVFVFGREVNDFLTVDYDAIAMLNVSATQQLKKEKDEEGKALRVEIAELKAANDELMKRLQLLESKMETASGVVVATTSNGNGRH